MPKVFGKFVEVLIKAGDLLCSWGLTEIVVKHFTASRGLQLFSDEFLHVA